MSEDVNKAELKDCLDELSDFRSENEAIEYRCSLPTLKGPFEMADD